MTDFERVKNYLQRWQLVHLTKDIKADIEAIAQRNGVAVRRSTSCRNCWHDALVEVYSRLKQNATSEAHQLESTGKYWYKISMPVMVGRFGLFNSSTADARIEQLKDAAGEVFEMLYDELPTSTTTDSDSEETTNTTADNENINDTSAAADEAEGAGLDS